MEAIPGGGGGRKGAQKQYLEDTYLNRGASARIRNPNGKRGQAAGPRYRCGTETGVGGRG